jgi:hypothetical protein
MSDNNLPKKEDHFHVVRCQDGYASSNVVVEQITSVEGNEVNMLTLKRHDDNWTQIIHVTYTFDGKPIEKHVTYKFPRDMDRVGKEYKKKAKIWFKYMETERYEQHLTYFCTYQIGQSLTVNMKTARTIEPYLAGAHMKEELEHNFHVPLVHGTICNGFTPAQRTNKNLKCIMEQEITHLMEKRKHSTGTVTTGMDEEEKGSCTYCNSLPCVWASNKEAMLQFYDAEHGLQTGNGIPLPNIRREGMYRQMALVINDGSTGKGV